MEIGLKQLVELIHYLGIYSECDKHECYKMNWLNKIEFIQKLIDSCEKRKLSLFSKVTIIKCPVYSACLLTLPVVLSGKSITSSTVSDGMLGIRYQKNL